MKRYTNKNTFHMKSERAPAPVITYRSRWKKGTLTIEAAFAFPLFLFACLCLIWTLEIQSIRISIISAAQNAAKNAAQDTAVIPVLNTVKLKSDIISLIGEERISRSIIENGTSGLSCWRSYMSSSTGQMNITVGYRVRLPLPIFGSPSAELQEKFVMHGWNGSEKSQEKNKNSDIVYMTDNGAVYHKDFHCSYLHLSIRFVSSDELKVMRNIGGGKYYPCEKCVIGEAMAGVYVTESGGRYHNSLNCSGLKRTIHAVKKSDIFAIGGCSRCSG